MRALVLTGPGKAEVHEVEPPAAAPGEVVVDVERAGVCGTDVELFTGEMSYLHTGRSWYPLRPGHEWCGRVTALGDGVPAEWLGRRVTGDTMLSCRTCDRCRSGRHHVCGDMAEIGISRGRPGALAEQLAVPVTALHALPDTVDSTLGALVEPGGNALRAARGAGLRPGGRLLVLGTGTIGLLTALFARAGGAEVHLLGQDESTLRLARHLGFGHAWTRPRCRGCRGTASSTPPTRPACPLSRSTSSNPPAAWSTSDWPAPLRDRHPRPGAQGRHRGRHPRRLGRPGRSHRRVRGRLGRRPPLVAATVGLAETAGVLAGHRPADAGPGPKIHIDPRR
ncbi:zinc-dependent alcohol dehydrogenase [Thermocatellispora tengchongensis]|uniref:zinc-dependent alcohol dehydrogenase n=1 Tax=Thermocatellispora tengchongensis TaxID=1073253 RepID=UPI00362D5AAF